MGYEQATLDMVDGDEDEVRTAEAPVVSDLALSLDFATSLAEAAAVLGLPSDRVKSRLMKAIGLQGKHVADTYDLQEGVRVLHGWQSTPTSYVAPPRRPRGTRPEGMDQLPLPRATKTAVGSGACGLCGDATAPGEVIGRFRASQESFAVVGWLCEHRLYWRRERPRHRDIVVRIFHHLLAGNAVDFNAYECRVLADWLTSAPVLAASGPRAVHPLDATVDRLHTAVAEGKPSTWIAAPTAVESLLAARQHTAEWQTEPSAADARRYGTRYRYRVHTLKTTTRPSILSDRGRPFDLHYSRPAHDTPGDEGELSRTEDAEVS